MKSSEFFFTFIVVFALFFALIFPIRKMTKKNNQEKQELYDQNIDLQLQVSSLGYRFDKAMSFATFLISGVDPDIIMFDIYKEKLAIKD